MGWGKRRTKLPMHCFTCLFDSLSLRFHLSCYDITCSRSNGAIQDGWKKDAYVHTLSLCFTQKTRKTSLLHSLRVTLHNPLSRFTFVPLPQFTFVPLQQLTILPFPQSPRL